MPFYTKDINLLPFIYTYIYIYAYLIFSPTCLSLNYSSKFPIIRTSLVVQWLRLPDSAAGGAGSIPGQGTKILNTMLARSKKQNSSIRYLLL